MKTTTQEVEDQTVIHQNIFRKCLYLIWSHDFQLRVGVTKSVMGCWLRHALESVKAEAAARASAAMTVWFTVQPDSLTMTARMKIFFLKQDLLYMQVNAT